MKNKIILSEFKRFRALLTSPGLYEVILRTTEETIGVIVLGENKKWVYHDMTVKGFTQTDLLDLWSLTSKVSAAHE